jgi:hypothetical protein
MHGCASAISTLKIERTFFAAAAEAMARRVTPFSPPSGLATGSFNGLNPKQIPSIFLRHRPALGTFAHMTSCRDRYQRALKPFFSEFLETSAREQVAKASSHTIKALKKKILQWMKWNIN